MERCVAVFWATARPLASARWAVAVVVLFHLASGSSAFASEADDVGRAEDALEAAMLETMGITENGRDETTSITAISLGEHAVYGDLWVAHGAHNYEAIIAVFARSFNGDWGESLARSPSDHYSIWVGMEKINVGPSKDVYFAIRGPAGVRNCDITTYRFDGEQLSRSVSHHSHCDDSHIVQDLNGDGIDEMLMVSGIPVFHRFDGVFDFSAELAYWNGSNFVMVYPSPGDELVEQNVDAALVRRMVEADLWVDASLLSVELSAQTPDDVSLRWSSFLIEKIASLNTDSVSLSQMPFLSTVFAGDYALAFEMMRANFPEVAFSPDGPLVVGTTSEGMFDHLRDSVAEYLLDHTKRAVAVRPDDPHIHAVRALALALDSPDDTTAALDALERAAALAPQVEWLRQAPALLTQPRRNPFTVQMRPADAHVRLLGREQAYEPGMLLPPGSYQVEASAEGYETATERVSHGTEPTVHRLALMRSAQPFTVVPEPADALVRLLDHGEPYQPGMLLRPGAYRVEATAEGYETATERVFHGTEPTVHRLALMRSAQPFTVVPEPADALVRLLDHGEPYQPGMLLRPGAYRVEATAEGYETATERVFHGTEPTVHRLALMRSAQPFTVVPEPADALVRLLDHGEPYQPGMLLWPGAYRVEASAEDHVTANESVMHGMEPTVYQIALRRILKVGDRFRDCSECPEMVVVPAGSYRMGSPPHEPGRGDDEGPVHRVTFAMPFAVGRYEVTFAEWDACAEAEGCGRHSPEDRGWGRGQYPVINVSWNDAQRYVQWLSKKTKMPYRLLSESEWEYVARAGTSMSRYWGDGKPGQCRHANGADVSAKERYSDWPVASCRDGHVHTAPVGSFAANGWGLHDMLGNVSEWTEDCWSSGYAERRRTAAHGSTENCTERVLRGGSWDDVPSYLRAAKRDRDLSDIGNVYHGFRVARTLTP